MTVNKIERDVDDPMWSGRLVQSCDGGWLYEDCTLGHLSSHLVAGMKVIEKLLHHEKLGIEGHGVLPVRQAGQVASLFELLDSLQRCLPWVEAWCVGHEIDEGSDGTPAHFEVVSAHLHGYAAYNWKKAHAALMSETLIVKQWPVPVLSIFDPRADALRFAGNWVD